MRRFLKWAVVLCVGIFFLLWAVVAVSSVTQTVRQRLTDFEDPDYLEGHPLAAVTISASDGIKLSAWYIAGSEDRAVILLAGINSNRNACRSHAVFYLEQGFSVLMPDLRGSGKSNEGKVTVGWQERKDVIACYEFLKERGYTHIGADGISLGAAAISFALPDLPDLSFVVLESSYDTFKNAVRNRLAMYHTPHFIAYPFYLLFAVIANSPPWRMRPVDFVGMTTTPTLILAGDSEKEIPVQETQSIFDACSAPLKRLHFFKGAGHWMFLWKYPEEYKEVVLDFLDEVFHTDAAPATQESLEEAA
ncbi:MAG: prolyl oligopeptidase family serine peptidase [Candidatus Hydrogenedentes bacterium]|nr:prolyl oligopeptidase family serine peptidase [Candidatus Hydrogenedentota bacterium]